MIGRSVLTVGLGLACWTAMAHAAEWPQFRGPESAGVAESAFPSEWGPDKNVEWKVKIPGVAWSSPIVWGDKVFLTTATTENQPKPPGGFGRGGGPGGRGMGPGGVGGGGGGGFGGGFGGAGRGRPSEPGQILPPFVRGRLQLTADQTKQADELQKQVDVKLAGLLNDEQKKELKEPAEEGGRRRGRFGPPPTPGQLLAPPVVERLKLDDKQKQQLAELEKETAGKLDKIITDTQRKELQALRENFGMRRGGPGGGGRRGGRGGMGGGMRGTVPDKIYRWEVLCLDRNTGKVLWKEQALQGKPRIAIQANNSYATETPVTDGKHVFAYFGMHGLYCYDLDGKLVWKKDLGAYPTVMGQGPASSPVLDGDRIFLQIDNEEKSFLVALDTKTGNELWRADRDERTNHSSPVIWKNKVHTELVTNGSHEVRAYDPANGKVLWELGMGGGRCYSSPVGDADLLYVGSEAGMGGMRGGGGLYAVKAGASGDISLKEGETANAGVAWSQPRGGPEKASPLLYAGHLYVLRTNGGIITCYDAKTGKQLYRQRIPGATAFWTSPWAGEGKIFCLDDAGTTHVLDAGPEFKVLASNKLDELFWASPAIAGNTILLRGVENLYCIGTK